MAKQIIGALPRWKLRACENMDPELFFADDLVTHADPVVQAACNRCVISAECLDWAMKNNELFGVWGGTTPKQRKALKRPIIRLRCPGCASEAILEEPTTETCLSCGLSWKI